MDCLNTSCPKATHLPKSKTWPVTSQFSHKATVAQIDPQCRSSTGFRLSSRKGRNGAAARLRLQKASSTLLAPPVERAVEAISVMYEFTPTTSYAPAQSDMVTREITISAFLREIAAVRPKAKALLEVRREVL